eukprot:s653_g15.t1
MAVGSQEEQLAKELDAKERRHLELSEEAQDAVRKLQIQNQRLELKVASKLRSVGQEEEAMKGMQQALEEAHQELHTLRAEQQTHLADSVGAKVRVRAATESFEAMCQERAELHEELHDTKLRFCNSQLEHAAEKTESMAARGSLKQLEMKLQAALRSEQQYLQDYQQQTQALQRVEASEKALTAKLLQVEAELDNCEATRANELSVQHSKLQYEEAHVKDLQSALASLQAEHEGLLWQFQVERAQSEDRYQDLTKEVHELRTQEMELKLKVAHTDDLHNLLSKRTEESVYELQKARDELSACQGHLQAEEEELRRVRTEEAELRSRDTILVQLQSQETERARRSDWLREESEERLASAFQMTERLQQSLDSANEALKSSVQSQHSKDELYTNLLKDYRSLQDEEQRRQRAQDEIQQQLMEEGARVKALEALKHREEETIERVSKELKEASEEHQANSLKHQAQIKEMKAGQEQLLEQVKQETNEQLSHLCETNRSLSAECRELLSASREADEMHQGNVQRMQKNLDEMKAHCASCETVADSMRKHAETLTAHLRLAQDEVKARSVMLAHTEEQAAVQRQQHLLEMKELEDEYAKQAWQADKNELKIQEMMAESSSTAAETVSRIARSQEKEAKAAAKAEQLEVILRDLRATLAHSQEESSESSKQILSLQKANSDVQEKLAENQKLTGDLKAQIYDLEDQLKLCRTELHESEARYLQQQQQQISQERSRQETQEMQMERMQQQCQMSQVQMSEAHDALQAKEKEIRHLEQLQEEDQKRHSSLSSLRDQLDFNCRELNHQIQQLNAVNKEEQKKSTAIQLRLEQAEAEAQYAASEAVQSARQQEFAFETLMARCSASEHSVQQLEETRKQLRAQLAAMESRARESERYAEQVVASTALVPAESPDAVRRNLEAKGLELTELEFTLREVELNSDRLQQYLEQSQSNLEMQTEEKIRLEDHYAASRRQLMDTEAKLREAQGQCSYWKSQHQSEEQRAQQWETKVEDLLRDLQCLQSELAKFQGLPPTEPVLPSRDAAEIRQLQQELDVSLKELQLVSGQAKEQAEQLEHSRSVQQNLMAARAQLDEGYREAQERLEQAEERLDELRAQGNSARRSEARHYQEELLALRTAQTTMEAQSQARERSAEERVQKLTMDLRHLSQKHSNLLEENQDRKAAALNLEDSIRRLRTDVDHMSIARKEEGEMFMHQEDATRHFEIALEMQTQRTEELLSENSNLHSEIEQLERRCRGQEEKSAQTLQGALTIEKQLLAVRAKHGQLQEAYREQRHLRAKEAEDGRASTGIVDALKEELSQLREEAAAERAVREETDRIQEEVEEKVRRLHSEELQGIHFEHNALRSALHLQRRNSTAALEAQRWALRREKQLRKRRYALLMAASEELRGGLMRLKEATDEAAQADASVEDQDQQVAEELEQVKLDQQALSDSRVVEQEKMARLDEVQLQLKDERKAATPNHHRIQELLAAERHALEEVEKQEAVVAEDKRHFNEDYKKLEEAHAEERASRERAEAYHQQVAAETQLLAVDLLKLQGVFEADGESESNFSQGSKGVREGRPLLEEASEPGEDAYGDDSSFLRKVLQEETHMLMTQLRGEIAAELRQMHRQELNNFSLQIKQVLQEAHASALARRRPKNEACAPAEARLPKASVASPTASSPSQSCQAAAGSSVSNERHVPSAGVEVMTRGMITCCPNKSMLKLVAHELKAPLNGLAGYTRTLAETDSKHQKEFKLLSNTAQFALDNVTNLTDLWTYANYEIGGLLSDPVNLEELNVVTNERIGRSVSRKGKPIVPTGVAINMTVEDSSDAVKGDFNALSLLEYHLVSNSAKFTEKGQVDVSWEKTELGICLTVQDTGIGCSPDVVNQIFEPFVVEDSSESRKREGIGLGLAVVREICRLHDAKLSVESTKGAGSRFRVIFPERCTLRAVKTHRQPRLRTMP